MRFVPLPLDPRAIPDIFIYLVRASPEVIVSYARIKAVNLLAQKFEGKPCWYELQVVVMSDQPSYRARRALAVLLLVPMLAIFFVSSK